MSDSENRMPLPPATFEFLVASMRFQAELAMGVIKMSEEDQTDLDTARHVIDLLSMLEEKTRGNLSLEEKRLIENSVTELRFRFVQAAGQASKSVIVTP
jgi:hypothetical protein